MSSTPPPVDPHQPEPLVPAGEPAVPSYDRREPSRWSPGRAIGLAVAALLIGGVGGYLIGHSSGGSSGPKTFAEAVQQFRAGKLPAGNGAGGTGFGGGGFGGGAGGGAQAGASGGTNGNGNGNAGGFPGRGGFGGVVGRVTANDGSTITVETRAGSVKVVLNADTKINKTTAGAVTDLATGTDVRVQSSDSASGSGGSVTASTITEVPAGSFPNVDGNPPAGNGAGASSGSTQ